MIVTEHPALTNRLRTGKPKPVSDLESAERATAARSGPNWCHRPRRHCGLRLSRNACMPSAASGSWLAAAITSIAYA